MQYQYHTTLMGNLLSYNKNRHNNGTNAYEPFINNSANQSSNQVSLEEQIKKLSEKIRLLESELNTIKIQMDIRDSRIDTSIQNKYNELLNSIIYHNEKNNEKIIIITKDMENLLNNDKILLDKLIEKNIVSTIHEA